MTHRLATFATLVFLVGCNPWAAWQESTAGAGGAPSTGCPAGQLRYTCTITLRGTKPGVCGVPGMTCDASFGWTPCAATVADAELKTQQLGAAKVDPTVEDNETGVPTCAALALDNDRPISDDFEPTTACACMGPAPSATCIPGSDPCTACLNACCEDFNACAAAGDPGSCCTDAVDYWQGTGPACNANNGTEQSNGLIQCWEDNDCADICQPYALRLRDGGLGSGGAGGGSP